MNPTAGQGATGNCWN